MYIIPNSKICFMHIPKTAGQAITSTFKMKTKSSAHSFNAADDKMYVKGDYIRFCVVRDPIARFVSSYMYNLRINDKPAGSLSHTIRALDLDRDINDYCSKIMENPSAFNRYAHIKRQVFYIRQTKPDIILRQENLNNEIGIIFDLLGKPKIGLNKKNINKKENSNVNSVLNNKSVELLKKYYEYDFRFLNYGPSPKK